MNRVTFRVTVVEGPDRGLFIDITGAQRPVFVGQGPLAALRLTDKGVSRRHIALSIDGPRLRLVDRGSTNGTRVNGLAVVEARLEGGETLAIGDTVLGVARTLARSTPPREVRAEWISERDLRGDALEDVLALDLPFPQARRAAIAAFERRYVERVLAQHNGNVSQASAASGIARRYLQIIKRRVSWVT